MLQDADIFSDRMSGQIILFSTGCLRRQFFCKLFLLFCKVVI